MPIPEYEAGNFAGAAHVAAVCDVKPSELGRKVADLLGDAWAGIYHLPERSIKEAEWGSDLIVSVKLPGQTLATYDGNALTLLVILAHDACLRFEVEGMRGPRGGLVLHFWQRRAREGSMFERHPTIERAVENVRRAQADGVFRRWPEPGPKAGGGGGGTGA